jgi:hypothetical protein
MRELGKLKCKSWRVYTCCECVQGLPKTRSGKIMRRILRKVISQEVRGHKASLRNLQPVRTTPQQGWVLCYCSALSPNKDPTMTARPACTPPRPTPLTVSWLVKEPKWCCRFCARCCAHTHTHPLPHIPAAHRDHVHPQHYLPPFL